MISVQDLVFDYPGKRALDHLTLDIEPGTILALVGPNGAGKTTLIRCITALMAPFSGKVLIDGTNVHEAGPLIRRRVGYLPDFFGLYDALPAEKCLLYAAYAHGIEGSAALEAVERAAERLEIESLLPVSAGDMSRGQRQRVAIAQSIIHNPDYLFLDEPASGLDPDSRLDLSRLFRQLGKEGMTIVVSSHILAELEDYASHMAVIRDGNLIACRSLDEGADLPLRRLRIRVAEGADKVKTLLQGLPEVRDIASGKHEYDVTCLLEGEDVAQSALLQRLMTENIPVIDFVRQRETLKDRYVETVSTGAEKKEEAADA